MPGARARVTGGAQDATDGRAGGVYIVMLGEDFSQVQNVGTDVAGVGTVQDLCTLSSVEVSNEGACPIATDEGYEADFTVGSHEASDLACRKAAEEGCIRSAHVTDQQPVEHHQTNVYVVSQRYSQFQGAGKSLTHRARRFH